eukprot:scaffold12080_cov67-Phaeocystis_antarctica.AAC.9
MTYRARMCACRQPPVSGACAYHQQPVDVRHVVHAARLRRRRRCRRLGVAKHLEHLWLEAQEDAGALGAALLVRGGELAKGTVPRPPRCVERASDRLTSERVWRLLGHQPLGVGRALVEELAGAVPQQLVHAHLHLERLALESLEEMLVGFAHEADRLVAGTVRGLQHVAERYVLEAVVLPYGVVVGDVDASGHARAAESEHLERREVGAEEYILLEHLGPGEEGEQCLGPVDQPAELAAGLLVDARDEALPLAAHARRVAVGLDESNVRLDGGAFVLDPVAGGLHVVLDGSELERAHHRGHHLRLLLVGRKHLRLAEARDDARHEGRVVAAHHCEAVLGAVMREGMLSAQPPHRVVPCAACRRGDLEGVAAVGGLEQPRVVRREAELLEKLGADGGVRLVAVCREVGGHALRGTQAELPLPRRERVHALCARGPQPAHRVGRSRARRQQQLQPLHGQPGDELGVAERLVVAEVAVEGGDVDHRERHLVLRQPLGLGRGEQLVDRLRAEHELQEREDWS